MNDPVLPPSPCQLCVEEREHGPNAALSDGSASLQGTQSLQSPQILVLWICRWTMEEERIQPYTTTLGKYFSLSLHQR